MIKVLLADDHSIVRAGIRHLVEAEDDIKVCAEASDGLEALEQTEIQDERSDRDHISRDS